MGLRGPSSKPVEARALEGSDSRVIAFPTTSKSAEPPADLGESEREIWRDVTDTFPVGFFKSADRHHLAAYCHAVALWQKARTQVDALGEMIGDRVNPWLRIMQQAHQQMVQLGDRLGIGPSRRTLSVEASGAAKRKSLLYSRVQNKS